MKFRNHYNLHEFTPQFEVNTQPSMTVPDMSLSIVDIITKHTAGIPDHLIRTPVYYGESIYVPDLKTLDLADQTAMQEAAKENMEEIKKMYKKIHDENREKLIQEAKQRLQQEEEAKKAQQAQPVKQG